MDNLISNYCLNAVAKLLWSLGGGVRWWSVRLVIDDHGRLSVSLPVSFSRSFMRFRCAKMAEQVEVMFGEDFWRSEKDIASEEGSMP